MSASLTLDQTALENLVKHFDNPKIREEIDRIPQNLAVAALVGQAIRDNFDKEGPGWPPLKASTIRGSVNKTLSKKLSRVTDDELLEHETLSRKGTNRSAQETKRLSTLTSKIHKNKPPQTAGTPSRQILKRTGLLFKSVTTPKAPHNIWKAEGSNLIWGTDLIYAGIHNTGGIIRPKKAKVLAWTDNSGSHFAKQVTIPKREYLVIRDEWMDRIVEFIVERATTMVLKGLT